MAKKFIAQCTPSLGTVSIWWSRCLQCVMQPNNTGRSIFYLRDKVGGEIAEVRNALVDQVLRYDREVNPVSHIFWVDDDVLVFPGCLLELLHQDKDITSGVYFTKLPGDLSSPLVYPAKHGGTDRFVPDRAYRTWGHGMGLTLVRTEVYKRMLAADGLIGRDKYDRSEFYHTSKDSDPVFQDESGCIDTGHTEDLYFLEKADAVGAERWVVTTKHAFGFHYDSAADKGYPEKQWNQWVNGEKITWNTPGGVVIWE